MITDECRKRYKNVSILFDNCSQKSFLTQEAAKALNLRGIRKEKIIINGFGGKYENLVILGIVRVIVHNTQGKKCGESELYVVPFMCKPLCNQEIELGQATYEHLVSLKLADSSDDEAMLNIDLLIGADYYWDFVMRDVIRGDYGPVAVKTSLGWVRRGKMIGRGVSSANLVSAHVMAAAVENEEEDRL